MERFSICVDFKIYLSGFKNLRECYVFISVVVTSESICVDFKIYLSGFKNLREFHVFISVVVTSE
jgi:hypothetical protein